MEKKKALLLCFVHRLRMWHRMHYAERHPRKAAPGRGAIHRTDKLTMVARLPDDRERGCNRSWTLPGIATKTGGKGTGSMDEKIDNAESPKSIAR